ncbi:MAG: hypothetical protein R3D55_23515 [Chloroflexota bacterium]
MLSVALSKDGSRLATASADRTTKLWDTATGQTRRTYLGHTSIVNAVAFDPGDGRLATASADRTARINTLEPVPNLFERASQLVTRTPHTRRMHPIPARPFLPDIFALIAAQYNTATQTVPTSGTVRRASLRAERRPEHIT